MDSIIQNRLIESTIRGNVLNPGATFQYPTFKKIATFQFNESATIIALVLSASLSNFDTQTMGVAVSRVDNAFLNISNNTNNQVGVSDVFITQLTDTNCQIGSLSPISRTTALTFSPRTAVLNCGAGSTLSIYGTSGPNASSLIVANLSIFYTSTAI